MSELDSLIDELFPANKNNGGQTISTSRPSCRRSEWDDESDGDQQTDEGPRAKMHASQGRHFSTAFSSSPAQPCTSVGVVAPTSRSGGHSFDDDSDADVDVGRVAAQQQQTEQQVVGVTNAGSSIGVLKPVLFPVPFPSLTSSEGSYACAPRCYLTNLGAPLPNGVAHPTLRQLRAIAENEQANAKPPHAQVMLQKGAFHAAVVELGNGSLDHHGDYTGDGGCPHILCRQCNYMVVRLQDAQWDVDGEVNLYLTLRNYYPDWCRLASSTPVGGESSAKTSRAVLSRSLRAAAYCCQCSWMTVKNARAVIETKLTDVALARPATESGHPFATEFPLPAGETRRPPLWKKKSSKKEVLPDPSTFKNGTSTVFVGGWSSYSTIESVSDVSKSVIAANTGADGALAASLPRTNILVLPTEDVDNDIECEGAQAPSVIEVADQLFVEGVSRHQCAQAQSLVKTWAPASVTRAEAADPSEQSPAPEPTETPPNPYADALDNKMYTQAVSVGAAYAARDVVIRGRCSIEGVAPNIVVPPKLPPKPDLDAVMLDPPAAGGDAGNATTKSAARKKKASAKNKKKKPKLTPEQVEELDRKKAELEAQYMKETEEAVRRAKEEADYLMTFAHPSRWAHVVFRHITFTGPVEVCRAHVEFQNCRFVGSPDEGMSNRPLLLVSQYCQVQCTRCSFEVPPRCGIYALPSAQVEVRKCLFTGVTQDVLWAAGLPSVSPQITGATSSSEVNAGDNDDGDDDGDDVDAGQGGRHAMAGAANAHRTDDKGTSALSCPVVLSGGLQEAARDALAHRAGAVGILTDCAKLLMHGCDFLCLGIGVYVKGSYSAYISHNKVPPKTAKQLTQEACDTSLDGSSFHHFANAALFLDRSARLVSIRRSYVEASAHYGLDCQGGANSVLLRQNYFATDATVRIREGAKVAMLHNDFQSIPLNDNPCDNPCLQPVY